MVGFPVSMEKKKYKVNYSIILCLAKQGDAENTKHLNPDNYARLVELVILYLVSHGQTCKYISKITLQATDSAGRFVSTCGQNEILFLKKSAEGKKNKGPLK